jgi:hypothetical protein
VSLSENFAFHFSSAFYKNGIIYPANHYPVYKKSEKVIAFYLFYLQFDIPLPGLFPGVA